MNELQIFKNPEFGEIRVVEANGKHYAVGVDVARALEYSKPSQAVIDHCKGIRKMGIPSYNQHGAEVIQETNCIPAGDIYRLIIKAADQSKSAVVKEKAERYERWVFDEVLPSIGETGSYTMRQAGGKNTDPKHLSFSRASLIWEMSMANPIPEYKQICAHYASAELNSGVAFLPLPPVVEKTYTAKEVGEMLGGISANMVGRMANKNGMKTPEYGQEVWDKSPHSSKQVSSWRYNEKAVEELRKLFAERSKTRTEPLST